MSVKVLSAAAIGLDCELVEVETDNSPFGNPGIFIVGLPDKAVDESKSRVRSAIKNSELDFPRGNVTVNLAPADLRKYGTHYDLPIAISCLLQAGEIKAVFDYLKAGVFAGELALDGGLRSVNGVLSMALMCQKNGIANLFIPESNAREASLVEGLNIYPVKNLRQLFEHLIGRQEIPVYENELSAETIADEFSFDMAFVRGQEMVKRALEIAAAGSHNILMSGSPGSGKSLLAKTMPSILPKMTLAEKLEVTKIYSVAGALPSGKALLTQRPFRSPHHTASGVALVGGGAWPRPGEISLSHRGVLFLDEFLEFPKMVLENLRQPLEDGIISVSRASSSVSFPAKFILVAAMNPCPCGYLNDSDRECVCHPSQIVRYQKKASGPLLDRIDLHIEVPRVKIDKLENEEPGESSAEVRFRVQKARDIQTERFKGLKFYDNSEMGLEEIKKFCALDNSAKSILRQAAEHLKLSARSYFRILKLSRTIADLDGSDLILTSHVAEALQYRPRVE